MFVQEKNPRGTFWLCRKFVNQGILKNPIKRLKSKSCGFSLKVLISCLISVKGFLVDKNMLTESAMFDFQSWAPDKHEWKMLFQMLHNVTKFCHSNTIIVI